MDPSRTHSTSTNRLLTQQVSSIMDPDRTQTDIRRHECPGNRVKQVRNWLDWTQTPTQLLIKSKQLTLWVLQHLYSISFLLVQLGVYTLSNCQKGSLVRITHPYIPQKENIQNSSLLSEAPSIHDSHRLSFAASSTLRFSQRGFGGCAIVFRILKLPTP